MAHLEEATAQLEAKTEVGQYFTFSPALTETEDPQISPLEQQVLRLILQINESKRQRSELVEPDERTNSVGQATMCPGERKR